MFRADAVDLRVGHHIADRRRWVVSSVTPADTGRGDHRGQRGDPPVLGRATRPTAAFGGPHGRGGLRRFEPARLATPSRTTKRSTMIECVSGKTHVRTARVQGVRRWTISLNFMLELKD